MARAKPWLKMWTEWLHDPKMLGLTLAETGAWWKLVTLAQELAQDGRISTNNGLTLNLDEIANCLHLTRRADIKDMTRMIEKMQAHGGLHWDGATLVVTNFAKRQAQSPSTTREAVRDRVRRHRSLRRPASRECVTESPLQNGGKIATNKKFSGGFPPVDRQVSDHGVTDNPLHAAAAQAQNQGESPQKETESVTDVTALPSPSPSVSKEIGGSRGEEKVTGEPIVAEVSRLYERNIGMLSPRTRELVDEFAGEYRGPIGWIGDAFAEAARYSKRSWPYVRAILLRWQDEGKEEQPHGKRGKTAGEDRRDPLQGARDSGWKVTRLPVDDEAGDED